MAEVNIAWTRRSFETPNPTVTGPYLVRSEQCEHRDEDPYVAYWDASSETWCTYNDIRVPFASWKKPSHWIWLGG
jgi:hypothetical protein